MESGLEGAIKGVKAGTAICMVPYSAGMLVSAAVPTGMTGVFAGDIFISSEAMMTATMTAEYSLTFSNMLVTLDNSAAKVTGYQALGSIMGPDNYRLVSNVSAAASDAVIMTGLLNPKLYGDKENDINITQNAMYDNSEGGTVWDNIKSTQDNYPNTNIPKSFEVEVNGQKMWVHGNATEHIYEDIYAKIMAGEGTAYTNPNLYAQELISDFYGSLEQATVSGIKYGEIIPAGNWEFIFAPPRQEGLLPVIKHAQFNGW